MEDQLQKKRFWMVPFSIHATRGVLRDQRSRRKMMGIALIVASVMLITGLTVLRQWLSPHEHPWRFIFFWFACAWETILMLLLALFDLLLTRAHARATQRALREEFSKGTLSPSPGESDET